MKKMICLLSALLILLFAASALGEESLPQAVADLCASAHPGYTVAAWDSVNGQYALVLKNGSENRLCIAETLDGVLTLTIDNPTALRQGDEIPKILLDSVGDVLFFSYHDADFDVDYMYHAEKQSGAWGSVDVIARENYSGWEYLTCVRDGKLCRTQTVTDDEGNVVSEDACISLPVDGIAGLDSLADFDISALPAISGTSGILTDAIVQNVLSLPEGASIDKTAYGPYLYVQYTLADGTRHVAACSYDAAEGCRVSTSPALPEGWELDDYHSYSELILTDWYTASYSFEADQAGNWTLAIVQTDEVFTLYKNAIWMDDTIYVGTMAEINLREADLSAVPKTLSEALSLMDSTDWRVVCNPISTDRLRLRDAPGGNEIGRYYNGTPVQVLEDEGEWAHVRVGDTEGYMMTAYLAGGKQGVGTNFLSMLVREDVSTDGITLYASPDENAEEVICISELDFGYGSDAVICGTAPNGWYHVILLRDGLSGYVSKDMLWEGNG